VTRAKVALTAVAVLSVGCAVYRGGELGVVPEYAAAPVPVPQPSISVVLAVRILVNDRVQDLKREVFPNLERPVVKAYEDSGYFERVVAGLEPSDLRAEVRVTEGFLSRPSAVQFSGLTLLLLPHFREVEISSRTTFVDAAGRPLGTIEKAETVHYFNQLFAIAIGRLSGQYRTEDKTYADLQRATVVEAAQRGWLQVGDPAKRTGPGSVSFRSP
jgi:hypothetical protein